MALSVTERIVEGCHGKYESWADMEDAVERAFLENQDFMPPDYHHRQFMGWAIREGWIRRNQLKNHRNEWVVGYPPEDADSWGEKLIEAQATHDALMNLYRTCEAQCDAHGPYRGCILCIPLHKVRQALRSVVD